MSCQQGSQYNSDTFSHIKCSIVLHFKSSQFLFEENSTPVNVYLFFASIGYEIWNSIQNCPVHIGCVWVFGKRDLMYDKYFS